MLSHADLMQLVNGHAGPCVSLYMPTHATGRDRQQDEIRLNNLVRDTRRRLARQGLSRSKSAALLEPIEQLPQAVEIWRHRSEGLAAYAAGGFFRCFTLPAPLPEVATVEDRFLLSPLLPLLHANERFFVLAVGKDSASLYEATRYAMAERPLPELQPVRLEDDEQSLQYHSHRATTGEAPGDTEHAVYHGHGGVEDREKLDVANFFKRQVAPAIAAALKDQQAPLVLVCVDYLAPLYREANTYPNLVDRCALGSPAELAQRELRDKAWEAVAPTFRAVEAGAVDQFNRQAGSGRTATDTPRVVEAARGGRVDTLFVPLDVGLAAASANDPVQAERVSPRQVGHVEVAAEQTLLNGGRVLAVAQPPGDGPLAAVLRY